MRLRCGVRMDISRRNSLVAKRKAKSRWVQQPGANSNLMSHPGVGMFDRVFAHRQSISEVQDALVAIKDLVDEGSWPFALCPERPTSAQMA